jgi:glycine oxidase
VNRAFKDVLIAGGGIVGMSIAWRLAQRGLSVAVYDAGVIGGESSWAGAGMLAPGGETESDSPFARSLVESNALYGAFVEELTSESGVAIDYRACGALEFTDSDPEWGKLTGRAAMQQGLGIRSEIVKRGELYYPDDGVVDPRDVVRALRVACERRGVEIREGEPVRRIGAVGGAIVEPRPAACAVVAAGAWSSSIAVMVDGERQTLAAAIPVRGHLVSYQLEKEAAGPVLRNGATYIVQRSSGLTVGGSTHEHVGFDRTLDLAAVGDIERRLTRLLPRLAGLARVSAWVGFRPATENGEAQTGRVGDSPVYVAYGHYRNGILLAPWLGNFIANLQTDSTGPGARPR